MSDNSTPAGGASLPPPPTSGAAPGQPGYENGSRAMPPPLSIPQAGDQSVTSPTSGGSRRAAPEPNKRALYVGGLDPRVTEDVLKQIFETTGHVQSVKIIPDKNVSIPDCTWFSLILLHCVAAPSGHKTRMRTVFAFGDSDCIATQLVDFNRFQDNNN